MFHFKTLVAGSLLMAVPLLSFSQFSISGNVSDKQNKEPIAGATVRIERSFIASQSNTNGIFTISNLKSGTYIVHASFIGYRDFTDTINVDGDVRLDIALSENTVLMDEVEVQATRAGERSAMAYSMVTKEQIAEQNLGQDLPYLLDQQVSVVTTSDAGTGVGYTGIRIRGSDATRVNVTINGIPVNDAESQGTYWVDLPDIASSIDNIQVQRGVGTSTNGAGAFGGSLNIQTTKLNLLPYAEVNSSYGSFNTLKNTVNAGTGLINNRFAVDARLSKISSDGFIDRGTSDLRSYYLSGAYYGKKTIIKFITFSGYEETYQAWNGIPESRLHGDIQGMNDYIARNGLDADDAANLLNSGSRTYNQYTYGNQVDHYRQDYYQLHFSHAFSRSWNANVALHFTKGKGYYEEYKKDQSFGDYGYDNVMIGNDTITSTNLVRRRWLDNNFYGTTFSLNYDPHKKLSASLGGAWNRYDGLHYGEVIWAQYASNSMLHQDYYRDTANKTDLNIFIRANYLITKQLSLFADVQYRTVDYSFLGFDDNLRNVQQTALLHFVNPKLGLNFAVNPHIDLYASYSIGNKEPGRDDYTQSTPGSRPKPETLNDLEAGYRHHTKIAMWQLNAYYMNYKNQLVLTGEINDVGAYNRTNVAQSYREGIEAEFAVRILRSLSWNANATLSRNKIRNFSEYIDNYDSTAQRLVQHKETDIAFSPAVIAGSTLTFEPLKDLKFSFISKYVNKQYMDNTSSEDRKLDAFFVNNFRIGYTIRTRLVREIGLTFVINNIFNEQYESNGYTYGYIYGGEHIVENFYFPQAGTSFMGGITLKF